MGLLSRVTWNGMEGVERGILANFDIVQTTTSVGPYPEDAVSYPY